MFGYLILISIDFYDFLSPFLLIYIKHSRPCLTAFLNTLNFVKNTPLCITFSTLFFMFGNVVKHGVLCLIYYLPNECKGGQGEVVNPEDHGKDQQQKILDGKQTWNDSDRSLLTCQIKYIIYTDYRQVVQCTLQSLFPLIRWYILTSFHTENFPVSTISENNELQIGITTVNIEFLKKRKYYANVYRPVIS